MHSPWPLILLLCQVELDWGQLPALAELALEGVQLTDATAVGLSALQQLSTLNLCSWSDGEDQPEGPRQSAIARFLRASPAALSSLGLEVRDEGGGSFTQFQPELAAAIGSLTQLRQLTCEDLGAACQLSQLRELHMLKKTWSRLGAADLVRLRALRSLTRLKLHRIRESLSLPAHLAELKSGVQQVLRAFGGSSRLGQDAVW